MCLCLFIYFFGRNHCEIFSVFYLVNLQIIESSFLSRGISLILSLNVYTEEILMLFMQRSL